MAWRTRKRPDPTPDAPETLTAQSTLAPFTWPELAALGLVDREGAWSIPAVAQGLQVISGTVGGFPIRERNVATNDWSVPPGLVQIDPDEPREVTMTRLVEDLVLFPTAYLVVLGRYAEDMRPRWLRYVPHEAVTPPDKITSYDRPQKYLVPGPTQEQQWRVYDEPVAARDIVQFRSHWPGLLATGQSTLALVQALETASTRFAKMDVPLGVLKNSGADLTTENVQKLLAQWDAGTSRNVRYLNALLDYLPMPFAAEDLGLEAQREHAVAEVARLMNLPAYTLNAPQPTSLTYRTLEGQRRDLLDLHLRPYLTTVEARLSMDDLCPRGQVRRLDVNDYMRANTQERWTTYQTGLSAGFITVDEVREREDLPPLPESERPAPPEMPPDPFTEDDEAEEANA